MDTRIFYYTDHLKALVSHQIPVPIHVYLDTTRECNHRCWYCYEYLGASLGIQREESVRHYAPVEELISILEELAAQGISAIDFCGGEPLLHPHAEALLSKAVELDLKFGLVTNGTLLSDALTEIVGRHACWVRFSIDTVDERLFDVTRRPVSSEDSLENVLANIAALLRLRKAINRTDFLIGVNCVVDKRHIKSMYATAKTCKEMGVDYVRYALVNAGKSIQDRLFAGDTIALIMKEVERAKTLVDDSFFIIDPDPSLQLAPASPDMGFSLCYWSLLTLTIDVDGNIYTCPEMKHDARYAVGNLRETPLNDLIYSDRRWDVAQQTQWCSNCCHIPFNRMVKRHLETTPNQLPFICEQSNWR